MSISQHKRVGFAEINDVDIGVNKLASGPVKEVKDQTRIASVKTARKRLEVT